MFWIINDNIKFIPEKNRLVSLVKPELSVILTSPASRCLHLLLESWPDIVLQKDLFQSVWGEDGMLVPANTLYQNISIVRRGLRKAGETDYPLILTVPRRGFQIDTNVNIVRGTTEEDTEQELEEQEVVAEPVASQTLFPEPEAPPVEYIQEVNDEPPLASVSAAQKVPRRRQRFVALLAMICSFALGFLLLHYPWFHQADLDFFKTYTIHHTENGCHFYSKNDDIRKRGNFTRFRNMIKETGLDCKKYPWIYFSSSSTSPSLSAFACPRPFEDKSSSACVTLYFMGVNDD